jgi:glycosyltransferase involved in cell wall biosynthesis
MGRIVLDCERMKYEDTGLYHYCLQLGKCLKKHLDPGVDQLTYYYPGRKQRTFDEGAMHILQNPLHKFCMPKLGDFDIWHSTYQNTHYMPSRNRRIKVVLTIHDLNFMYDDKKSDVKKQRYLANVQKNIDRSDAIVCISDFSRNDVMRYCDTANKSVTVIHNGTNALIEATLLPASYRPAKKFLFAIGVMARKKNFHALLPLLENNDLELLIAGRKEDMSYLNYLVDSARQMGVSDKLRLLGPITENEKSWYFQNCYAFASSSTAEGFCMPVTEAMSVGKPLFLSDRTALPEIGGRVAFYFSDFSKNNMQHVFSQGMNSYNHENMQPAIKERAANFCWDRAAQQYIGVYRSLL